MQNFIIWSGLHSVSERVGAGCAEAQTLVSGQPVEREIAGREFARLSS